MNPIRHTLPACCALAATGVSRLRARTTASPIRRIGTSVGMAGGESNRYLLAATGSDVAISQSLSGAFSQRSLISPTCHLPGAVCRETLYLTLILALGEVN